MQYKTINEAVEAIKRRQCSIRNDDVECLQRACKHVWPECIIPSGRMVYYFQSEYSDEWFATTLNPFPNEVTATDFCRLMDEDKGEPIDLGQIFDENASDYRPSYFNGRVITREKFVEIVTNLIIKRKK